MALIYISLRTNGAPSCGSDGKEPACNAGDTYSITGWGRSPGEGNGNPLQYSCLESSKDRGAWVRGARIHGITETWTWLSNQHLMTSASEDLFMWVFTFVSFPSLRVCSKLWPCLWGLVCFLVLKFWDFFLYSDISQICIMQIFSPSLWLDFSLFSLCLRRIKTINFDDFQFINLWGIPLIFVPIPHYFINLSNFSLMSHAFIVLRNLGLGCFCNLIYHGSFQQPHF